LELLRKFVQSLFHNFFSRNCFNFMFVIWTVLGDMKPKFKLLLYGTNNSPINQHINITTMYVCFFPWIFYISYVLKRIKNNLKNLDHKSVRNLSVRNRNLRRFTSVKKILNAYAAVNAGKSPFFSFLGYAILYLEPILHQVTFVFKLHIFLLSWISSSLSPHFSMFTTTIVLVAR
jgi:hypothetical protein